MLNNYMRVLNKVRCAHCGFTAYDADVEKHEFKPTSKYSYNATIYTECPECGNKDCFVPDIYPPK